MKNLNRIKKGQIYISKLNNIKYKYIGRYMSKYEFVKIHTCGKTNNVIIDYSTKADLMLVSQ